MPRLSKIGAAALGAFGWTSGSAVTASYLVVAGGGGGGTDNVAGLQGGGGGAGGFLSGTASLNPTQSYTVTVGAGGSGGSSGGSGSNASNSLITGIATAIGGGGGGSYLSNAGGSGGSGGGGAPTPAGTNTASQGNNGGTGTVSPNGGGGGGGAGAVGGSTTTPNGGVGLANPITGSTVGQLDSGTYYLAGGGGGRNGSSPNNSGTGGLGGGGTFGGGGAGTANTGGGAGGTGGGTAGSGGSGVVIISYVGAQQFGGGVVTSSGGNTIHTFTTSGTLSPLSSLTASALIVAGGGAGGGQIGGGGGAGGYQTGSGITLDTNSIYAVTVGAGGTGTVDTGGSGGNSSFSMVSTASVGGGGGGSSNANTAPTSGGSGGGSGGFSALAGGAGTAGQGNAGGIGNFAGQGGAPNYPGGGGGGATGAGANSPSGTVPGSGGAGTASSISGTSVTYATGGTGGLYNITNRNGVAGTANTGNGGEGAYATAATGTVGGNGGSGVVIISYAGSTQQMAGGTVTVAGGNVIHTFTSSGYLTPIVLVNNSLRFRSSASAYLNRTATTPTNAQKGTFSAWVKRGILTQSTNPNNGDLVGSGDGFAMVQFYDQNFYFGERGSNGYISTAAVFRDPAAWYHFVCVFDTTLATANDRLQIWVNGVRQTAGTFNVAPTQNSSFKFLNENSTVYNIGAEQSSTTARNFFDGYLTEVYFIDGQALTPNSFGTFNGLGVWQPIRYGGSYGTNGFYLPFTNNAVTANFLVVAGGGGGGHDRGGGGGAGGLRSSVTATGGGGTLESALSLLQGQTYTITVGAGGIGETAVIANTNGSNSSISGSGITTVTSTGGGRGGGNGGAGNVNGGNGGSGGGARNNNGATGGTGTVNQGFAGGSNTTNDGGPGGGGGGAGTVGKNGSPETSGRGNGGSGVATSITGSSVTYAGGGGGGGTSSFGTGGSGGGGSGASTTVNSVVGTPNTGGGGGAGDDSGTYTGKAGGSGVVIISYAGSQKFTGGSVTSSGGNTIHTFTSSGTLASNIAADYSPNGNNWTPNNISLTTGSTYDSMTDVPTLTSATTANYCVWSPINRRSTVQIKNTLDGNLNVSGDTNQTGIIFATIYPTTGKWYYEFSPANTYANSYIGCGNTSENINQYPGNSTNSVGLEIGSGRVFSSSLLATYTGISAGEIGMIAWDCATGKVWMGRQGAWFNSGDPAAGTGQVATLTAGEIGPMVTPYLSSGVISTTFGQRPFSYTPPSGFLQLNTFNLPTPTIGATASTTANKYFDATVYTGTNANLSIVNSGSMQPDFVWIKNRGPSARAHNLVDSVRGSHQVLFSNDTAAEATSTITTGVLSFASNGFNLGLDTSTAGSTNASGESQVGWQWKANGTGVTNTAGSITSTVSANTTAGFSIVTYTGTGSSGSVGHGLGVAPSMIIIKSRSSATGWRVYQANLGITSYLVLNSTAAVATASMWGTPNSTTFIIGGTGYEVNESGSTYVAYCFAPIAGYSAFGSYTGNGSSDGPFIFTGFRPKFILVKNSSNAGYAWLIWDSVRETYNVEGSPLFPNLSNAEGSVDVTNYGIDFVSNGFKIRATGAAVNNSGHTYIYMAFAESPFKYANAR